jgi:hypothetical protein
MSDFAELEARIAAARTDLAAAVEQLSDRVSPKKVESRSRAALQQRLAAARAASAGAPLPQIGAAVAGLLLLLLLLRRRHGK